MDDNFKSVMKKFCPLFVRRIYNEIRIRFIIAHQRFVTARQKKIARKRRNNAIEKMKNSLITKINVGGGGNNISKIEIETLNRCNNICPFCPVNVNQPQREYAKMPNELFNGRFKQANY